jgi:capsule polysaccharide export protein KpsE/RkpR
MFNSKIMNDYMKMAEYDVKKGSTLRMSARLRGGVFNVPQQLDTHEALTATLAEWARKLNYLETENEKLKKEITEDSKKAGGGLRKVVPSGSKELVPKKFQNIAVSGSFKAWSR